MKRYGFIAIYEDIGHFYEGSSEGAHCLGVLAHEKLTLEHWLRFATLINHSSLHPNILPNIEEMPKYIDQQIMEDESFNTRYKIIDCERGEPVEELFSDNFAYLKVVSIGEIDSNSHPNGYCSPRVLRGPIAINVPPRMDLYNFRKTSSVGDSADEVFANIEELMKLYAVQ